MKSLVLRGLPLGVLLMAACSSPTATPSPTPTATYLPGVPTPTPTATATPTPPPTAMTFQVTVPSNTPEEDAVFIISGPFRTYPMQQTGPFTWSISLTEEVLGNPPGWPEDDYHGASYDSGRKELGYAYTRGQDYLGGEAFPEDPPHDQWNKYRVVEFAPGTVQRDTVERWRWFPPEGTELPSYPATLVDWAPRLNGAEYEAGVFLADIWDESLVAVSSATNQAAMSNANATWVQIAPPWDNKQLDPTPIISNVDVNVPAYDDAALREHIREIKASGLKLTMEPQVCCEPLGDTSTRSDEWLIAWFDQYEAFLLYHAQVAEEEGVDKLLLDWSTNVVLPEDGAAEWVEPRWRDLMAKVRTMYSGPIGYSVLIGWEKGNFGPPWPLYGLERIEDLFDFWGVHVWQGFSTVNDPTQEDLDAAVEEAFTAMLDPMFADHGKPIVLSGMAYGSFDGGAKSELGVFEVALETYFPERQTKLVYDGIEQAMVMQAIMRAVASRPYIVGSYPFLYQYNAQPLSPDYSVRGKPAEGTLADWYALATQ